MTAPRRPETTHGQELDLRAALGAGGWRSRKALVGRLLATRSDPVAEQLLQILRDDHRDLSRANAAIEVLTQTASDVVPGLLALLGQADADLRCYVAQALGERGDPRAIPALIERLTDDDTNVRSHAIEALGKLRAAEAVDPLLACVEELNFELAFPALEALQAIGDRRIAHRLTLLLHQPLYKLAAIEALGELGDEEIIGPLLDRLHDREISPQAIGRALARMHERHQEVYGACEFIPDLVRGLANPAVVRAFVATGASDELDGRLATVLSWLPGEEIDRTLAALLWRLPFDEQVIQAVARRGSEILPLLTESLAGASPDVRRATIEVLVRIADRKAVPALLEIVDLDDDELTIARALEALTRLSEPRLYPAALKHFGHPSARVRQAAVAAFGCVGRESAVRDLQALWSSPAPLVRESVLRAAAYLGDPAAIDMVIAGCSDSAEEVRRTAIEHLANIADSRSLDVLRKAFGSESSLIRTAAVTAISRADLEPAVTDTFLRPALRDPDVWVRYFAIRALIHLGRANQHLQQLLAAARQDPAMQVRIAAMEALGYSDESAKESLAELANSPDTELAEAALVALSRAGHPQALSVLTEWLSSSSAVRQRKAVEALAVLQTPEAVEILQWVTGGPDHRLATEAIAALGRIPLFSAAHALLETLAWPRRQVAAIQALVAAPTVSIPALQAGLLHASVDVRRAAVEALARTRTPSALKVLETALLDSSAAVRHAALTALAHRSAMRLATTGEQPPRGGP